MVKIANYLVPRTKYLVFSTLSTLSSMLLINYLPTIHHL